VLLVSCPLFCDPAWVHDLLWQRALATLSPTDIGAASDQLLLSDGYLSLDICLTDSMGKDGTTNTKQ